MGYTVPTLADLMKAFDTRLTRLENASFVYANPDSKNDTTLTPLNFTATASFYDGPLGNAKYAKINWTWEAPPQDPNDLTADPVAYYMFQATPGGPEPYATTHNTSASTTAMPINSNIIGSVYVVTESGRTGPVVNLVVNTQYVGGIPPQPSTPTVTAALKGVRVLWNGNQVNGTPMPNYVQYVDVHSVEGTTQTFTPDASNKQGRIYPNTTFFIPTFVADGTYKPITVILVAYDNANQPSPKSTPATATPTKANEGDIESINAGVITTGYMSGERIAAGTITANLLSGTAIDGKTITGAVIRTSAGNPRLQMDNVNGFTGYNSAGTRNIQITTAGNLQAINATLNGVFETASTGTRIRLRQSGGIGYVEAFSGHASESLPASFAGSNNGGEPTLTIKAPTLSGYNTSSIVLTSEYAYNSPRFDVDVSTGKVRWIAEPGSGAHVFMTKGQTQEAGQWFQIGRMPAGSFGAILSTQIGGSGNDYFRLEGKSIQVWGGGLVDIRSGGPGGLKSYDGATRIMWDTGSLLYSDRISNSSATTLSANIAVSGGAALYRVSSSKRYKVSIQDFDKKIDLADVKKLRVVTYVDKAQYEENNKSENGLKRAVGLIAEEVDALSSLSKYVVNRKDGLIESVDYDRIAMLAFPWLQELEERLTTLEAK